MSVTLEQVGTEDLDQLFRDTLSSVPPCIGIGCRPIADKFASAIVEQAVHRNIPVEQLIRRAAVEWQRHFHQFDKSPTYKGEQTIQNYYIAELASAFARQLVLQSKNQGPEGDGVDTVTTAGAVQAVVGQAK